MNEAHITLVGWIAADPFYTVTKNGNPFLSLRVGCTPRRFDRQSAQWQDGDTMFLTVNCWRSLADNVASSQLKLGDPVVVTGRLRIREYVKDDQLRFSVVIDAITLGHDLTRGHAHFQRVSRGGVATAEDQEEAEHYNDRFADGESRASARTDGGAAEGHWPDLDGEGSFGADPTPVGGRGGEAAGDLDGGLDGDAADADSADAGADGAGVAEDDPYGERVAVR